MKLSDFPRLLAVLSLTRELFEASGEWVRIDAHPLPVLP